MGCHTWFYNRMEPQPEYEIVKESVIKSMEVEIHYHEEYISGLTPKEDLWMYIDSTIESIKNRIDVIKRKLRMIKGGYCKIATMKYYAWHCNFNIEFSRKTNMFYTGVDYHDVFRVSDFPADELFSFEETMDFIEKRVVRFVDDDWKSSIENFWKIYPNGMINFG